LNDDFFIGWADTPKPDRRFLLRAAAGLIVGGAAAGAALGSAQNPPGPGQWDQSDVREWRGMLVREPYPMLRTREIDGEPRTAFLMTAGKNGVVSRLHRNDGPASVRGSIIIRGANAVIAVADGDNWIGPAPLDLETRAALSDWAEEDMGEAVLIGEVLDAKCWFGAMRPGWGKTHKACASLCLRSGAPAAFCAGDGACGDAGAPLLLDADGRAHGAGLSPLAADPARASGRIVRVGDVTQLRAKLSDIVRL
jgi:hypothetical protein